MEEAVHSPRLVRFGTFEVDVRAGELRKAGVKLRLTGQPFQVLAILLERPGGVVTREELQKRLWPDTFVDVDHNLNTAINKIREVLGDSAESPRFVETLPRRGYRFVAPVEGTQTTEVPVGSGVRQESRMPWVRRTSILFVVLVLLAAVGFFIYRRLQSPASLAQRTLTRLTFDDGLQIGATWSPDGRFIAYSSNRGGKFDIWVQQVSGGDPVQITKGPGHNWQPDWSPDGKYIAYRSEDGEGGLFVVPALGGEGLERRIAPFGYYPRWSPDSSQILFQTTQLTVANRIYIANLSGSPPHEVLRGLFPDSVGSVSAAWHPDGKRITTWAWDTAPAPIPTFWTAPIVGGMAVRTEIPAELMRQVGEAGPRREWWTTDFRFSWAPSGKAIYFERTSRAARNIWRMSVDPQTLRAGAIERLTTGPGFDTELSLSADGKKLAFTGESRRIRAWVFPFDATQGRVSGSGHAVTSPGTDAWLPSLSRDGKKLAFSGYRGGNLELRETSLSDGREVPIVADDFYSRYFPQWSPDGAYLAYTREEPSGEGQLMMWSSQSRTEEPLTTSSRTGRDAYDWSGDGKWLLISQENSATGHEDVWLLPVASRPNAEAAAQKVTSSPAYDLYQPTFLPTADGSSSSLSEHTQCDESTLYVMPATGGPWIRITDGKHWDDKPRWSPDGKTIYFVSGRDGFFNVWGIRFDAVKGKPVGDPFQVTSFESPSLMVPTNIPPVELSFTQEKLVLTIAEVSGSIWILDNVGP